MNDLHFSLSNFILGSSILKTVNLFTFKCL